MANSKHSLALPRISSLLTSDWTVPFDDDVQSSGFVLFTGVAMAFYVKLKT
jgi:hypothetical protein